MEVLNSYSKQINLAIQLAYVEKHRSVLKEQGLKTRDSLGSIQAEEGEVRDTLKKMQWDVITHHPTFTEISIGSIIFTIAAFTWFGMLTLTLDHPVLSAVLRVQTRA